MNNTIYTIICCCIYHWYYCCALLLQTGARFLSTLPAPPQTTTRQHPPRRSSLSLRTTEVFRISRHTFTKNTKNTKNNTSTLLLPTANRKTPKHNADNLRSCYLPPEAICSKYSHNTSRIVISQSIISGLLSMIEGNPVHNFAEGGGRGWVGRGGGKKHKTSTRLPRRGGWPLPSTNPTKPATDGITRIKREEKKKTRSNHQPTERKNKTPEKGTNEQIETNQHKKTRKIPYVEFKTTYLFSFFQPSFRPPGYHHTITPTITAAAATAVQPALAGN